MITRVAARGFAQCHRLRNEAAQAQQKEQEIGKQTRQALMENDALSRTVERLQKSFTTWKARNEKHPFKRKLVNYAEGAPSELRLSGEFRRLDLAFAWC